MLVGRGIAPKNRLRRCQEKRLRVGERKKKNEYGSFRFVEFRMKGTINERRYQANDSAEKTFLNDERGKRWAKG